MEPSQTVAIFGQLLPGSAGGIETNLLKLLASLAAENGSKDRQLVIGPGGESGWFRPHLGNGQEVVEWPPLRYEMPAMVRRNTSVVISHAVKDAIRKILRRGTASASSDSSTQLTQKLRDAGVEAVHFPYQRYFPTGLPFIFEPWDLQHIHLPDLFSKKEIDFRNWLYRQACEEAALVVTATHWTKNDLVRHFKMPPSKIAVVPRGAEFETGCLHPEDIAATIGRLQLPPRFALYPAKTWPHKNHIRLFQALAYLRDKEGLAISLVCTGRPISTTFDTIQRQLETLKLNGQVFFTGFLDENSMRHVYAAAELVVFPSLFEGLGIPVLEAMAYGVPVVCSRASCLPEIGGDAVALFDPYSVEDIAVQTARVWRDSALRADLRGRGYANIASFSWTEAARSFRVAYKYVANRKLCDGEAQRLARILS